MEWTILYKEITKKKLLIQSIVLLTNIKIQSQLRQYQMNNVFLYIDDSM